jgi:hypothetical protein
LLSAAGAGVCAEADAVTKKRMTTNKTNEDREEEKKRKIRLKFFCPSFSFFPFVSFVVKILLPCLADIAY